MKFIFITISIFIFWTSDIFSQSRLTLGESIEISFQNSEELKIQQSKIISNQAKVKEVKSQFLPQLKLNASYLRQSNVDPYFIIIPFSPEPVQLSEVILNNYSFVLTLKQPIYTGSRLFSSKKSAEYMSSSSELDFDNEKNNLAANVRVAFWNYYKAIQLKKITDDIVVQSEQHLTDTRNFMKNGLATNSDVLKLEVQNSNARLQQLEAANNIELARVSFNKILGLPLDSKTELEQVEVIAETESANLEALMDEALKSRIELKSLDLKLKSADRNITAIKSAFYPNVSLFGDVYLQNPNLRIQPPEDKFYTTWDAGVLLTWDVWNWGLTSAQVRQAEQTYNQNKFTYDQLKENIELEVNQNYLNSIYNKEKIEVSKKAVEQAKDNYKVTKEKYDVQLATSTDIVDAETSLYQAETNLTSSLIDYKIALTKLYKSVGRRLY